jgi:hypothetical protein
MTIRTLEICLIMCSRHRTRERPWDGLLTGSLSVFLCFHGPQPDNLSSHNKAALRRAIENAGATVLFLPPYSPDLNAIEQPFAKLKALLRAKALRTVDALWKALGSVADCVSPQECKSLIRHAGPAMIRAR